MTMTQRAGHRLRLAALVAILALAHSAGALAAEQTTPVSPAMTTASPATSGLTPVPENGISPGSLLVSDQWIPTYACMPEEECVCRACMVGPEGQHWFRADYLLWWTRGTRAIPLVTTSDQADQGVIGNPTTRILFGDDWVNGDSRSGYRLNGGWWFHCGRTAGIEFDYFNLGTSGTNFRYASDTAGVPLYARPFYDVNPQTPGENSQLVSDPEWLEGTVDGRIDEYFHSAGVALRWNLCCNEPCGGGCYEDPCCEETCVESCGGGSCFSEIGNTRAAAYCRGVGGLIDRLKNVRHRVDLIAGYRHYQLNDTFRMNENLRTFENHGVILAGTTIEVMDEFRSRNEFHGGELGVQAQFYHCRWSLELLAKAALGNNSQVVTINGQTTSQSPGDVPVTNSGGLLALDSNIGRYTNNQFVVIPQFGAEVGYQLTCRLRAYAGYNLIYWSNVARAVEQVDRTVNSANLPPATITDPARPAFVWKDSNFWAQGMNFGLDYRF